MNSNNLINPLSPQQYYAWKRWITITCWFFIVLVIFFLGFTYYVYLDTNELQKKITILQNGVNTYAIKKNSSLHEQKKTLKQKLKEIQSFAKSYNYQEHLKAVSNAVPHKVRLTLLEFEEDHGVIKGQTQDLEFLLEFIHNLEGTPLFQSMNLVEMQPSLISYEEKKLVNFTIYGKLK